MGCVVCMSHELRLSSESFSDVWLLLSYYLFVCFITESLRSYKFVCILHYIIIIYRPAWKHWTYKTFVSNILSSVRLRFSPSCHIFLYNLWLSLPITFSNSLGLGHVRVVCPVCFAMSLWICCKTRSRCWWFHLLLAFAPNLVPCHWHAVSLPWSTSHSTD